MAKNGSQLWKQHNAKLINLLFAAFITVAWIISLTLFSSSASRGLHAYSLQELENVASEKAKLVDGALSSAVQTLSAAADNIAAVDSPASMSAYLRVNIQSTQAEGIALYGQDGTMLAKEGTDFAPPASALRGALGGQVTYAFLSAREVIFLVPVRESGRVVSALCSVFRTDRLFESLAYNDDADAARYLIEDGSGLLLYGAAEDADWRAAQGVVASDGKLNARLYEALSAGDGSAQVTIGKSAYYVVSHQFGVSGWRFVCLIDQTLGDARYSFVDDKFRGLAVATGTFCLITLAWMLLRRSRDNRVMLEEKDRLKWLEERYRIIARESEDVIFEISLKEKGIEANENFVRLFGYNIAQWNVAYAKQVHPDDQEKFIRVYDGIRRGERIMKEEMRIRRADGTYIWCRMLIAILSNSSGKPERILGKITNIDAQKREADWLKQKAEQDSLTSLFNKVATQSMIDRYLAGEGHEGIHGLLVLDVDDFKLVNDTLGHQQGDAVLRGISEKLRMQFRSTDIVGRIGGDEFMVFLKNVNSRSQLAAQAAALVKAFREAEGGRVSVSVGAALYPEDGILMETLFSSADKALYCAKKQGKARFTLYDASRDLAV